MIIIFVGIVVVVTTVGVCVLVYCTMVKRRGKMTSFWTFYQLLGVSKQHFLSICYNYTLTD